MLAGMTPLRRLLSLGLCLLALAACDVRRGAVVVQPPARHGAQASTPPGGTYTVVRGDTLYSIAFRHGVDFRQLAAWNDIAPPYVIHPGQVLRLGPAGVRPAPSSPTAPARSGQVVAGGTPAPKPITQQNPSAASSRATPPSVAEAAPAVAGKAGPTPAGASSTTSVPVAGVAPASSPPPSTPKPGSGAVRTSEGIAWRWPADGPLIKGFNSGDAIPGIEIAGKAGDPVRAAADGVVVYSGNGLVGYGELVIIKHNDSFLSAYGHNRKRLVQEGQRVSAGQVIAELGATGASRDELQFQIRKDGNPVDPLAYLPPR